jgi:hypothetical protein
MGFQALGQGGTKRMWGWVWPPGRLAPWRVLQRLMIWNKKCLEDNGSGRK